MKDLFVIRNKILLEASSSIEYLLNFSNVFLKQYN